MHIKKHLLFVFVVFDYEISKNGYFATDGLVNHVPFSSHRNRNRSPIRPAECIGSLLYSGVSL